MRANSRRKIPATQINNRIEKLDPKHKVAVQRHRDNVFSNQISGIWSKYSPRVWTRGRTNNRCGIAFMGNWQSQAPAKVEHPMATRHMPPVVDRATRRETRAVIAWCIKPMVIMPAVSITGLHQSRREHRVAHFMNFLLERYAEISYRSAVNSYNCVYVLLMIFV